LTIQLSLADQATAGSFPVVVTNPAPGGGSSTAASFAVNNPVPSITSLSPASALTGAAAQTLTINGSNFLPASTVTYNSAAHTATFVNAGQLTIQLSLADQATAGSFPVVVTNPAPGGGPSNIVSFPVTGSVSPIVNLSSTSLDFGGQLLLTTSPQQSITLTNTGNAPLTNLSMGLSGANMGDFGLSNLCPTTVTAGNMCSINVTFTPSGAGTESATLSITDNAGDSPQMVSLTGTGVNLSVNWASPEQTIDGFGGAAVDFVQPLQTTPVNLADFFFDPNIGIGLSILRVQVIPDATTCTEFCNADGFGVPVSDCGCVASSGATILTGELQTIQQAQARGVSKFFASSWSPPASMKSNRDWITGGSFLGTTSNGDYSSLASILTSYVTLLNANQVNLSALSPQNEPDINQSYQSCTWTPQQFHDFIPYLYSDLGSAGFGSVKIMFPENSQYSGSYQGFAATTMSDNTVAPDVGIMAQHGYGGDSNIVPAPNYGKHLWITEDSSQSGTFDGSMADALTWAQIIHKHLTIESANAFVWWFLTDMPGNGNGPDNGALTDINGNIAMRAYITGNWSKFVRPGWHRVDVTNSGALLVSAFQSADGTQSAVVAVNTGMSSTNLFLGVGAQMGASVTPWITSAGQSLIQQAAITITDGVVTYSIPAQSVVTFVSPTN
jgi:O-glycosyl hydrolase